MFFCAALVILMIIKFRFPKRKTIHQVIERRYGRPLLNLFRKLENFDLKIKKEQARYLNKILNFDFDRILICASRLCQVLLCLHKPKNT